jgi:hypothetical protein
MSEAGPATSEVVRELDQSTMVSGLINELVSSDVETE